MTLVVSIGRNRDGVPMDRAEWHGFGWDVEDILSAVAGGEIVFSTREGRGMDPTTGYVEHSATWIVAGGRVTALLRRALSTVARRYGQDSIAVTTGETEFIEGKVRTFRRMFSTVTEQGTARSEDAVCEACLDDGATGLVDCTGNDALQCQVCGYQEREGGQNE